MTISMILWRVSLSSSTNHPLQKEIKRDFKTAYDLKVVSWFLQFQGILLAQLTVSQESARPYQQIGILYKRVLVRRSLRFSPYCSNC